MVATKTSFFVLFLCVVCSLLAEQEHETRRDVFQENSGPDTSLVRALAKLEKHMGVRFEIPFPANFDPDHYRKLPLASLEVSGKKVIFTRPVVNPYDEPRSVELLIGPEEPTKLGREGIDCSVDLDEQGDFQRMNIIVDWASDGTGNHQIERADHESSAVFFERARLTYQARAKNAKDSESAIRHLQALEMIAIRIQELFKKEL